MKHARRFFSSNISFQVFYFWEHFQWHRLKASICTEQVLWNTFVLLTRSSAPIEVNTWTKNGHEYEIVQSVWVIEMQVTLLHLSFVLFFQSQKKEDLFKICFFSMGL